MKLDQIAAQEAAARTAAKQLAEARHRTWDLGDITLDITVTLDADQPRLLVVVAPTSEEAIAAERAANIGIATSPLSWLTADQLRRIADYREKFEAWTDGGAAPDVAALVGVDEARAR